MLHLLISVLAVSAPLIHARDLCPVPNNFDYHNKHPQSVRSFRGIYHSNYNETITFCDFKPKAFELDSWSIIPVLAQTDYSLPYSNVLDHTPLPTFKSLTNATSVGAVLAGAVYIAGNGSVVWEGFGFSASGP